MRVLRRELFDTAGKSYRLYPLGDWHLGVKGCDEAKLERTVEDIARDPRGFWLGTGDYVDAVNRQDRRFDPEQLPDWIEVPDLKDLARAQLRRFREIVAPIAHKCWGLAYGNHEETLERVYERNIYLDLLDIVKAEGGFDADHNLRLGYSGWLLLSFFKSRNRAQGSRMLRCVVHHGAGGGGRTASSVNKIEDWLYSHACDLAIMGHTHKLASTAIGIESVSKTGQVSLRKRYGVVASTFLRGASPDDDGSYAERGMLRPLPTGRVVVEITPHADDEDERIKTTTW